MNIEEKVEGIIKELEKCKSYILDESLAPDRLSQGVVVMSGHLIRLGEFVAELVYQANTSYIYRKWKYSFEYNTLSRDFTVKDRDNEATLRIKAEQEDEVKKRRMADRVKTLHEDYRLFIMTIQTRLGVLKSELFSKHGEGI